MRHSGKLHRSVTTLLCPTEHMHILQFAHFVFVTDCPAGQTARISRTPAPNCTNPNQTEELIETLRCFCPPGMLAREDDTCVTPENCIGQSLHCIALLNTCTYFSLHTSCSLQTALQVRLLALAGHLPQTAPILTKQKN